MKIAILTFHAAFNYGSMLQAWALQKYLVEGGHEVEIIDMRIPRQEQMYRKPFTSLKPIYLLGDLNRLRKYGKRYLNQRIRWHNYNDFMFHNMKLSEIYNIASWKRADKEYDCIITGSDQIWNLNAYDSSDVFFGEGINSGIKLIAYAPSLGPVPENNNIKDLKRLLKKYSAVSVRENNAKIFLESNQIFTEVKTVLDPTMLLMFDDYHQFISDTPPIDFPYVYYYTPDYHPDIIQKAIEISSIYGFNTAIDTGYFTTPIDIDQNQTIVSMAGPQEFLSYLYHSKIAVGASFHLIVLAILMHKEFYCINGDKDSRLNNLLKIVGLENRIVRLNESFEMNQTPINWVKVDDAIAKKRDASFKFLKKALGS